MRNLLVPVLCFMMCVSLLSCGNSAESDVTSSVPTSGVTDAVTEKAPDSSLEIKISLLNGTTALGMAQLMDKVSNNAAGMNYNIDKPQASADAITGQIISGECAIAALPTNVAAKLYKKNNGKVQLLAVNTLGVLYLLQNGENITDFNSLRSKTIYLPGAGSNPEYITKALLEANGLTVGTDVILDTTTYPSPDALQTAVVSNLVTLAVLPEPKVTVTKSKNANVSVAMNFTEKWEAVYGENTLAQGCLVVNADFASEHPAEIKKFLEDYKASVDFISTGSDEALTMIVNAGILPNVNIAKTALPNCNICCISGSDMKNSISVFYEKLFASDSTSITALPDDGFYYIAK